MCVHLWRSALHHSADKTTRAQYNAPRGQKNAGTEYYVLSDEEDVVPARGSRPPCLGEPRGPQERDQQRTMEQIAVYAPMVQILDVPVAQMGEQLVDVLQFFDALIPVAEQIIEVPKIIIERIPPRTSVREPQLAEQLVEVPTIVSFSSLQRVMEQAFQLRRVVGDTQIFKVFSEDRVQQVLCRSLILSMEVFKVFAQDRVLLHHFHQHLVFMVLQMGLVKGFFALFTKIKKVRRWVRTPVRE